MILLPLLHVQVANGVPGMHCVVGLYCNVSRPHERLSRAFVTRSVWQETSISVPCVHAFPH